MKHPVPLLIATLFAFILGTSMLKNKTCPCGVLPPATSDISLSTTAKMEAAVPTPVSLETKVVTPTPAVVAAPKAEAARMVEATEKRVRVKELVLYFDNAQPTTTLTDRQRKELEDLQTYIAQNPNSSIKVVGHTDSRGSAGYNERLSTSRANFVADYLKNLGTDTQNFTSKGEGEESPTATNETAKGRARNRRVVVSLS
jgi:OmpA-OmpF porin, OOP family